MKRMLVGAWHEMHGGSGQAAGVSVVAIPDEGDSTLVGRLVPTAAAGAVRVTPRGAVLTLDETKGTAIGSPGGRVMALLHTGDGGYFEGDTITTMGAFPCSLAVDPCGEFAAVVNYGSEDFVLRTHRDAEGRLSVRREHDEGSLVLVRLDDRGAPEAVVDLVQHNRFVARDTTWQLSGHPHGVAWSPDGRLIAVADRGADTVSLYDIDRERQRFVPRAYVELPHQGPRGLVFLPGSDRLLVANELHATVADLHVDGGGLVLRSIVSTDDPTMASPEDPTDFFALTHPSGMVVSPDGHDLYVLNRGPDTVTRFRVRPESLEYVGATQTGGAGPWGLGITPDGTRLWIANRVAGSVREFRVDIEGAPRATGREVAIAGAVSIEFVATAKEH